MGAARTETGSGRRIEGGSVVTINRKLTGYRCRHFVFLVREIEIGEDGRRDAANSPLRKYRKVMAWRSRSRQDSSGGHKFGEEHCDN